MLTKDVMLQQLQGTLKHMEYDAEWYNDIMRMIDILEASTDEDAEAIYRDWRGCAKECI